MPQIKALDFILKGNVRKYLQNPLVTSSFSKFPNYFKGYYAELQYLPSMAILTVTRALPKCMEQAQLPVSVHKRVMFHVFPEKIQGDKLHMDPLGKHHLKSSLAVLWYCARDTGRKELHLTLYFESSCHTSLCADHRSRFWILKQGTMQ